MLRKIYFSIVTLLLAGSFAVAQNTSGGIKVLLKDKANGEAIPFANVVAYQNGVQVGVATTDMDGYATIKPLAPGKYDVKGVYVGYQPQEMKGVNVSESKTTYITIPLENGEGVKLDEVVFVAYQEPLIDPDTKSGGTVTREEYQNMATKNINSVAATTAGVFQADEGGAVNVRGGRTENTTYFVDGVKVIGGLGVPQQGVEQLQVITGGLPAQYGDATSGVISVTTRGPQSKFFGGVELISSQLTDAYGYNSIGFSVGGPIWQKKDSAGNKTPVIGFILSGQGTYEKDPDPQYNKQYKVKDSKLKEIENKPLQLSPTGEGFLPALQYVTKDDMEQIKARQNVAQRSVQLNGKLDFKITPNTNLTLGGAFDYGNRHDYTNIYALFNPQNNPQVIGTTWRAFANVRQKFGSAQSGAERERSQAVITNAYFTFLASYEQSKSKTQDDTHRDKIFDYGYIGKFNYVVDTNSYVLTTDPNRDSLWYQYQGPKFNNVSFERAETNATGANYTSQVFDYFSTTQTLNQVQTRNGLLNGDRPTNIFALYSGTGRQYNGYGMTDRTQLRFTSSFSADLKNHALMVGVEYDQRNESGYTLTPIDLWTRMRQLTNFHLNKSYEYYQIATPAGGDPTHPYYYGRSVYNEVDQTQIDKSIREMLGLPETNQTYINTDALNPNDLKLEMFSAQDLLGNGVSNSLVDYYGYDYLGKKDNKATSINDFLTATDSRGNKTFHVGAYKPIYIAGYIQDKFDYKDIKFNVGVRVDRFDANQKVLKDKYSFFDISKAGEVAPDRPGNIKDDYAVYVDAEGSNKIVGFRNQDTWYNIEGKEIADPSILTTGGRVYPWLKDQKYDGSYKIDANAFTDYKPQINVMPRVAFSFPISDVANFFAHYDVLTQRPNVSMRFDPRDYYFFSSNSNNPFLTNPNLKPEKTIDYELGYNQVLNEKKNAALKITAFYREMRNQITTQTINQAYPQTYYTYVNKDFGTVKGLSMEFDLRRTNGITINANYTLQFADGSGSNSASGANLASTGQPNLRVTLPLNYDRRHNLVLTLDYRFGDGKDYRGPQFNRKKKDGTSQTVQILQNVGANIQFLTGSGTPYTRYDKVVPVGGRSNIAGSLNGSNMPWTFRSNLRVDKNIELSWGKKEGQDRKTANLNIYIQVLNLFNNKNILGVFNYTGDASDDGYLASAAGQQAILQQAQANNAQQSFQDQYSIYLNNAVSNYGRPRTFRIGVMLDF